MYLLEVVGVLASQKGLGAPADEVVEGRQEVFKVVDGPLVEALHQQRPQRPHLLGYLQPPTGRTCVMVMSYPVNHSRSVLHTSKQHQAIASILYSGQQQATQNGGHSLASLG